MNGAARLFVIMLLLIGSLLGGLALVHFASATGGMSRYVYLTVDQPLFVIVGVLGIIVLILATFGSDRFVERLSALSPANIPVLPLAFAAVVLGGAGVHLVQHGYAFSMDEWMTRLQATIFLEGRLAGRLPEEWRDYGRALIHNFAAYDPPTGLLASDYRPGMAIIFAGFEVFGLGVYASAVLNALGVWLAASVARKIWPEESAAPVVAALLVLGSTQALAAATTSYAMSAHLCFNLLWLRLFLQDDWRSHILAALVGVATASLHQIHAHAFFAAPFLLTLLRPFRPGLIAMYAVIYLAGHGVVFGWDWLSMRGAVGAEGEGARSLLDRVVRIFRLPSPEEVATILANCARFIGWQSLALVPLLGAVIWRGSDGRILRLLAASVLLSLAPYIFLMPDQGHGWGYRYLHGLIGPVALLGAAGWRALAAGRFGARYRAGVLIALMAPVFVVPLAAMRMEGVVAPYARATDVARAQDAEVVVVDGHMIFYGQDIARADPFARGRPLLMRMNHLDEAKVIALCRAYRVAFFAPEDARRIGVPTYGAAHPDWRDKYEAMVDALRDPQCAEPG